MAIDTNTPRSRRTLLGAAAGAVAATAVGAVARPLTAAAVTDHAQYVNDQNEDIVLMSWSHHRAGYPSSGQGIAVYARSEAGTAVIGITGAELYDSSIPSGVLGDGGSDGGCGVTGQSSGGKLGGGPAGAGVVGSNTAKGVGVYAQSFRGVALHAHAGSPASIALVAEGVTRFSRSGTLTVRGGTSTAKLNGIRVDPGTLLLASLQQDRPGVWIRSAVPNAAVDAFTITLNEPVEIDTLVAWFLVN